MSDHLIFETKGQVGYITFNRPEKLNVLDIALLKELDSLILQMYERDDLRVLVLTGAGEKAFSAGADIEAFSKQDRETVRDLWVPLGHRVLDGLQRIPQVTIAALNGSAFGGGLELALACDSACRLHRSASAADAPLSVESHPLWHNRTGRCMV